MKDEGSKVFKLVKTNSAFDFIKNNTFSASTSKDFMQGWIQDSPYEGTPTVGGGAPTYEIAKISEKLHEIENILGQRGSPPCAPQSANVM